MKPFSFEYLDSLPTEIEKTLCEGHARDEEKSGTPCCYRKFALITKNGEQEIIGVLSAYTAYAEVYVNDIW